ncbi:MAG: hypothetical protein ABSG04_10080 [Verrucomicrobiota bacterium]|jgi:hypothetical protein
MAFALLILAASCGPGAANHNQLGAAGPVPSRATNPPAGEVIEFLQRSNQPDSAKASSSETKISPFPGSLLTIPAAAGKQEKAKYFRDFGVWASAWVTGF